MHTHKRVLALVATLALGVTAACSKPQPASEAPKQAEATSNDVAGLAKETLLVMKFHHDN